MTTTNQFSVRYCHESPLPGGGKQCANIMWDKIGVWPIRAGVFPAEHPVNRFGEGLTQFRERGYWVGPFPEGDGFTMDLLNQQTADKVKTDIRDCFGWAVN